MITTKHLFHVSKSTGPLLKPSRIELGREVSRLSYCQPEVKCTQTLLEQLEWVSIVSKRKPLTFKVHNIILLNYLHSSGGNLWILTFIWMPVDTNCPNTFTDQSHSWRGTGTPWKHWSGQCYTAHNCWCPPGLNMALIRVWVSYGGTLIHGFHLKKSWPN